MKIYIDRNGHFYRSRTLEDLINLLKEYDGNILMANEKAESMVLLKIRKHLQSCRQIFAR